MRGGWVLGSLEGAHIASDTDHSHALCRHISTPPRPLGSLRCAPLAPSLYGRTPVLVQAACSSTNVAAMIHGVAHTRKETTVTAPTSPTASEIDDMIDQAIEAGDILGTTGRAMKTSKGKVLAFYGLPPDEPITEEIVERASERFEEAPGYADGSRKAYVARLVKAFTMWQEQQRNEEPTRPPSSRIEPGPVSPSEAMARRQRAEAQSTELIEVPVTLRRGVLLRIPLPIDLTRREAQRLVAVIEAQVIEMGL